MLSAGTADVRSPDTSLASSKSMQRRGQAFHNARGRAASRYVGFGTSRSIPVPCTKRNLALRYHPHPGSDARRILEEISRSSAACRRYSPAPISFRISLPGEVPSTGKFGSTFLVGVRRYITPSAARSCDSNQQPINKQQNSVKEKILRRMGFCVLCWSRLYVGDPDETLTDSGS